MIGNDIIDRRAIRERPREHWERFREKTMTKAEQALLAAYRDDQLDIWLAWAIKESVYKLEYQLRPERYFAPKSIEVQALNHAKGKLDAYEIDLDWNKDYIHALTWLSPKRLPKTVVLRKNKSKLNDLILNHLQLHFPHKNFSIEMAVFPRIRVDPQRYWPLTKSHHGRWQAFAYLPP